MTVTRHPARRSLAEQDVLVLQHIRCEPPGVYEDVLRAEGARVHRVEIDEGDPLPDPSEFTHVVVMGGPMGAYDDDRYPWLGEEKRFIRAVLARGIPLFGACLGARLLAAAMGGRAYPAALPEVGVLPVELTAEGRADPVTGVLPGWFPTLQWHSDTFDLPPGAVLLASSSAFAHQAYRVGSTAYAVQLDLEVTSEMAAEWAAVPAYARALEDVLGPGALDRLLADFAAARAAMQGHAQALFEAWWRHTTLAADVAHSRSENDRDVSTTRHEPTAG